MICLLLGHTRSNFCRRCKEKTCFCRKCRAIERQRRNSILFLIILVILVISGVVGPGNPK